MNGDASGPAGDDDARFVLSFDGSEVGRVHAVEDTLHIVFSAARVRERPGPGMATGREGHVRSLEMRLAHAAPWPETSGGLIGGLARGRLVADGCPTGTPMSLPCKFSHPCRLELDFLNGSVLAVSAASFAFRFTGDPAFCEDFSC